MIVFSLVVNILNSKYIPDGSFVPPPFSLLKQKRATCHLFHLFKLSYQLSLFTFFLRDFGGSGGNEVVGNDDDDIGDDDNDRGVDDGGSGGDDWDGDVVKRVLMMMKLSVVMLMMMMMMMIKMTVKEEAEIFYLFNGPS